MSQPAIRSVAHAIASATTVVCNAPAGAVGGDVFIAVVATTANAAINVTAAPNLTWVRIGAQTNNGAGLTHTVFAHRVSNVAGREPATWTFNDGGTNTNWAVSIVAYSAMDFFNKANAVVTTGAGTTDNAPTIANTALANLIVVAAYASASNSTFSAQPAGYFIEDQINGTGVSVAIVDTQILAPFPAGTGVLAVTTSNAGVGVGQTATWTPSDSTLQLLDKAFLPLAP